MKGRTSWVVWTRRTGVSVLGIALWLVQVSPPGAPCGEAGDAVWQRVLAHDLHHGVQAGTEAVFTYGPLSYFLIPHAPYVPELFGLATLVRCLVVAAAVVVQLLVLARLPERIAKAAWLLALAATAPWSQDLVVPATLLALAHLALAAPRFRPLPRAAAQVLASGLALGKFTWCVIALLCLFVVAADAWVRFGRARAAATALAFAAGFLGWWLAAGQEIGHVGAYLSHAVEVGRAYADAMNVEHPEFPAVLAGTLAGLFLLLLLLALVPPGTRLRLPGTALVAGVGLLAWKSGAGRQGPAHALMLFGILSLCVALVPAPYPMRRFRAVATGVLRAAALAVGLAGFLGSAAKLRGVDPGGLPGLVFQWAEANAVTLADQGRARSLREAWGEEIRARHPLPAILGEVGDRPVDVFGQNLGIAFLHGMNVRHRPICQSYAATTAPLQALDAAWYDGPSAPPWVLAHLEPIDGRFAPVEDAAALFVLLRRYRPVLAERFYLLVERLPEAPPADAPREILRRRVALAEPVDLAALPGQAKALACEVRPSVLGRLRTAVWQAPRVELVLGTSAGRELRFPVSPRMVEAPFLVDPLLDSTAALARFWIGGEVERVTRFALAARPGHEAFVAWDVEVRVFDLGGLAAAARRNGAPVAATLRHRAPMFPSEPAAAEPSWAFRPYLDADRAGLIGHAPCRLEFALPSGRHELRGSYGMVPEVAVPGMSDGIEFIVSFHPESGSSREIGRRLLRPAEHPADGGPQLLSGAFEIPSPGRLRIEVGPGPEGNHRHDLAWFRDLEIAPAAPPR